MSWKRRIYRSSREARTRRATRAVVLALAVLAAGVATAHADERCSIEERKLLCPTANPVCPPGAGPAASAWPIFQHDAQHTGRSPLVGPTCNRVIWRWSATDEFLSAPTVGADGTIYVGTARAPVCAIDPASGTTRWCDTDQEGRLADRSSPAVAADGTVYVGTRDNDLWAIAAQLAPPPVVWRQKICTDGDVTTSPAIGPDGVVYMGSDSLGAGWMFAMCPGAVQQVKWCAKLGGGVKNVSPALSPDGATLYVTSRGTTLHALDAATGATRWTNVLERRRNAARWPNYTPVVDPASGKIYVGFDDGLFEVLPDGTSRLLFVPGRERIESPPALGPDGTLYFGASRGGASSTFYAVRPDGTVRWSYRIPPGPGRFRNNQAVVDANGTVYVAVKNTVYAFTGGGDGAGNGVVLWSFAEATSVYQSSPILGAPGRIYVGSGDRLAPVLYAIGDCP